ncbi:MAG: nicotianamine synthase [Deltaproteobacteria bacterium]|nr:nicotianamine synthase [Deltaproteobacteria bacterium]
MHDFEFEHKHELEEHDFLGCCKNCRHSLEIIKPHILDFFDRIKNHTTETLVKLSPEDLYRLYQILDDVAHLETGEQLGELILTDLDIRRVLPAIRAYYTTFFSLHEAHLAKELLKSRDPWHVLESFPLYPRYETLIRNQAEVLHLTPDTSFAFIGCGPVPLSLILLNRLYGVRSIGLDTNPESVSLAEKVLRCLELEDHIKILHGDESRLSELEWNVVLVAALAEPKPRIFRAIYKTLKSREKAPVIYRTYTGIRAVLYRPVQPDDIRGFRIIKQILPTGRVNNTLVLLDLE